MDTAYGVIQYIGILRDLKSGVRFMVFQSGDARYYLFNVLIGETLCGSAISFPVPKKNLKHKYRSALANGWGN